ncbi:MAG TPA: SH3 domain-containing protein [Saprospiraceae bacterium]|nr:SH3 domain-containing protein [Saprospiraceae bacterium]
MYPKVLRNFFIIVFACIFSPLQAQLRIGSANTGLNFREGPGTEFKILHTIDTSNLLVVLPREVKNDFLEVFDVETSLRGYVSQNHIQITDTLAFSKQNFFEKSGENATGDIAIELINGTIHPLFVWVNQISYDLSPREKKTLIFDQEEIIYFSSTPGLFPVFGKETLQRGSTYVWKIIQD